MKYKKICGFELYGYCLMDNHVHLLLKEAEEEISKVMMRISSSYVLWYNIKYARCGHLFQERFKSENVEDTKYFLTVLRYIHQNPLKAGLVISVWDSQWTSINEYLHRGKLVDIDRGLRLFSPDRKVAIKWFKIFMEEHNNDQCLEYVVRMSDGEVREFLRLLGITSSSMIQKLDKEKRDVILRDLKELEGVSIRQLSRITGISKSVIGRI
jgi:putative transposase